MGRVHVWPEKASKGGRQHPTLALTQISISIHDEARHAAICPAMAQIAYDSCTNDVLADDEDSLCRPSILL